MSLEQIVQNAMIWLGTLQELANLRVDMNKPRKTYLRPITTNKVVAYS
jgi:hypothetical protein